MMRKWVRNSLASMMLCTAVVTIAAEDTEKTPGYTWNVLYIGDFVGGFSGPIHNKLKYIGNVVFSLNLDNEKLFNLKDNTFFASLLNTHAGRPNGMIGSYQGYDNIEVTRNTTKIYQAWMQQAFWDKKASILVGLYDLNTEFYVTDSSVVYIMGPAGIGTDFAQTGVNGPSVYPTPAFGARLKVTPSDNFYFLAAALNGTAGDPYNPYWTHIRFSGNAGALFATEVGALWGLETAHGKVALGLWNYTAKLDTYTQLDINGNPIARHNQGGYVMVDAPVFRYTKDSNRGFNIFARYGLAEPQLSMFSHAVNYGLTFYGPCASRPDDIFGIAFSPAYTGAPYREANPDAPLTSETLYEMTYSIVLNDHVTIQPDPQYVQFKGDPALQNSMLGLVRFTLSV